MSLHASRLRPIFAALLLVATVGTASALDAAAVVSRLPRHFHGTFHWNGAGSTSEVDVILGAPQIDGSGDVVVRGQGEYLTSGEVTQIKVTWRIGPKVLRFEMLEGDPEGGDDNFITDGSHVGHISADLREVRAVWTTRSTGRQGRLELRAE